MIEEFGSEKRISLAPAVKSKDPIEAAWPTQSVLTLGLIYCIVS